MSIAALVTVAKGRKSPHVHKLRMDKRKWSIHMVEFYSAIKKNKRNEVLMTQAAAWMNREHMLSEKRQ